MVSLRYAQSLLNLISCFILSKAYTATTSSLPVSKGLIGEKQDINAAPQRLSWNPAGHNTWEWRGQKINYIEMGDPSKPALLLIHGFGASSYHFRNNIPELAKNYHVYAFDMLGFGCSSMPIQEYEPEVWRDQTVDFVSEVIGKATTIAGNSLGGLAALYASASEELKPLVSGCILLNASLRFKTKGLSHAFTRNVTFKPDEIGRRFVLGVSFESTKQRKKIESVLRQFYPVNSDNVDDELIESIQHASRNKNAAEVYYRVLTKNGPGTNVFADDLLAQLDCPLLLCWGTEDPIFKTTSCDRIQELYDQTTRVDINAGHCAHDEAPNEVNSAIHAFISKSM